MWKNLAVAGPDRHPLGSACSDRGEEPSWADRWGLMASQLNLLSAPSQRETVSQHNTDRDTETVQLEEALRAKPDDPSSPSGPRWWKEGANGLHTGL